LGAAGRVPIEKVLQVVIVGVRGHAGIVAGRLPGSHLASWSIPSGKVFGGNFLEPRGDQWLIAVGGRRRPVLRCSHTRWNAVYQVIEQGAESPARGA
jgi:hypothetical protein